MEKRAPSSRKINEETLGEALFYMLKRLNRTVVSHSQPELIRKTFQISLFSTLFPGRKEVPKTLIFAKNDAHADDMVEITRKIFAKTLEKEALSFEKGAFTSENGQKKSDFEPVLDGAMREAAQENTLSEEERKANEHAFCRKITSRAADAEEALEAFRHDYLPRIAVTGDMIATGIDVKAIECLSNWCNYCRFL